MVLFDDLGSTGPDLLIPDPTTHTTPALVSVSHDNSNTEPAMIPTSANRTFLTFAISLALGPIASAATENFDALSPGPPSSPWECASSGAAKWQIAAVSDPAKRNALEITAERG